MHHELVYLVKYAVFSYINEIKANKAMNVNSQIGPSFYSNNGNQLSFNDSVILKARCKGHFIYRITELDDDGLDDGLTVYCN